MKTKSVYKYLFLIFLFQSHIVSADSNDAVPVNINVVTAGTLSNLLGVQVNVVKQLTVTGYLNGTDFNTIRKMTNLTVLNMTDAYIVSGGGCYWPFESPNYYTSNNEIGENLFSNLINLTSLTLPNSIVLIREGAFYGCNKLVKMDIPVSVKTIDRYAFYLCTGLDSISIPDNVISIGASSFELCTGLRILSLPNSDLSIGEKAFNRCTGLKKIYCKTILPPTIDSNTFNDLVKSQCTVFVPEGTLQTYKSAIGWAEFPNITDGRFSLVRNQKASDIQVYVNRSAVIINGANLGDEVTVYKTSGVLVIRKKVMDSSIKIDLQNNNLYLVKIANRIFKVVL